MTSINNFRELTKKDKVRGLSRNSWLLILLFGMLSFFIFLVYGLFMTAILMIVLMILEYFDDDIYDILMMNLSNKFARNYYA